MPDFKPNHGLQLWFPLSLHDGGSGPRLYDGSDVFVALIGGLVPDVLICSWTNRGLTLGFL